MITACGGGAPSGSQSGAPGPGASTPTPTPPPDSGQTPTPTPTPPPGDPMVSPLMVASNWQIGPIIDGHNYSIGMPLSPMQTNDGWAFDFPLNSGSVHYVTYRYGSLAGKTHIVMHYRIEADPSVHFYPVCCPQLGTVGPVVYFQKRGDDWNTDGNRWWATFDAPYPIKPGDYTLDVPLNGAWTSVYTMSASSNPSAFASAKTNADRVGFTFGGGDGYGHGVYADQAARFVLLSFTIE